MIIELNKDLDEQEVSYENTSKKNFVEQSTIEEAAPEELTKLEIFETPLDLLAMVDSAIREQKFTLHKWQAEDLEELGTVKPTHHHPFKKCYCAANGSGKDKFIIAPFTAWFLCTKIRSKVIITSSSGTQLTTQTEKDLRTLCEKVNAWTMQVMGKAIFKINQRHIFCTITGSHAYLFATDQGEKAEGHHPDTDCEMAIIVNEAKSVIPEIFKALRRCTGYNYWLNVSSPGPKRGDFYKSWCNWSHKRRITFYDCPHQSPDEFEEDKKEYGESSAYVRSKWLALFTSSEEKTVVEEDKLENLRQANKDHKVKWINQNDPVAIGVDIALSTHGDETVISAFKGNKHIHLIHFKNRDATVVADKLEFNFLHIIGVKKDHRIKLDDGGVGRGVIDILERRGWSNLVRVLNQTRAKNSKQYGNRGAELWSKLNRLVEVAGLILIDDNKLYEQIGARKFKERTATVDKLILEAKSEMIAEGYPSPDRADATILAISDFNVKDFVETLNKPTMKVVVNSDQQLIEELTVKLQREEHLESRRGKIHNSLNSLLKGSKLFQSKYN